ncbi:MAG: oligosaccharide flippase family protein [Prolixibacteraceae bacterium]|nr:oligosaccharide flippase family protein [Prolixibacteraceae bacterium]
MKRLNISNVNALQFFQLLRYGSLMLIGILLSKSGLSTSNIGQYETFLLIAGAFTFFWVNGFLKAMMPMHAEKTENEKRVLIFNIFILLSAFALIAALLSVSLNAQVSSLLLNGNKVPMPLLLGIYILFNSPALMTEYIYMVNKQSQKIITYASIIFALQVAAVGLPPLFGMGLNWVIGGLMFSTFVKYVWLITVLRKNAKAVFSKVLINEFLKYGSPLVVSFLLSSSARYIDGFIVTAKFTPNDLAIFQYGARELPLSLLLCNSLSMAMLPNFSKKDLASPLAEFRSEVYRLHWLLFPVSIVLILFSHMLFPIVFNPDFAESAGIFNIYLLLVITRLLFPQTLLIAKKLNKTIVKASFIEIIVNVTLSIILVNYFGIKGVAYATVIAYTVEKVYLAIACKRKLNIGINSYLPVKTFAISSSLLVAVFILVEFIIY